ncbi:hypothetical protein [Streptomyces salinarius]|uniref:hypothetical protein n=1 Tax=Streptomyces salinarius TaxID=2762598 RepID=UPI001645D521|nr:hypothetical protein [Streptomyces salinarius]
MFGKNYRQRVRHQRLMALASILVSPFEQPAVPADLVALAFARRLEVTEEEAARYLDAALVARGERLPRPAGVDELPEPDTETEAAAAADVEAAPVS